MKIRILTASVLLIILGLFLYFYNYKLCIAAIIVITSLIQSEWEMLMKSKVMLENTNKKIDSLISLLIFIGNTFLLFFVINFSIQRIEGLSIFILSSLISIIWIISAYYALYKPINSLGSISKRFFYRMLPTFTSIAIIFNCLIILNNMWIEKISLLLFVLPLVWLTDSIAYFVGRAIGKRKLAKNISPKKTIEGALGGVIIASSIICYAYFKVSGNISVNICIYFIVLSLISIVGDLFQSRLKREFDIKDSSQLLPGHGGFFDRFDAAIPVILLSIHLPDYNLISKLSYSIVNWI